MSFRKKKKDRPKKTKNKTFSYLHFETSATLKSIIKQEMYRPKRMNKHVMLSIRKWNEVT